MREKPVPSRVGKELQLSETGIMEPAEEETNFGKEESENTDGENSILESKELPSMVSVVPLNNNTSESPSKYETLLYRTAVGYRPSLDRPGEFDFLNNASVSESQKQAVKFGVRVFRDWLFKQGGQFQSLEDMSRSELASALEQFYLTARRPNGTQYKKNTLKSIKHSLDHYLRASALRKDFSIATDYDFRQVNKALDSLPEDADLNRFPRFTKEIIMKLYQSGQLGLTTTRDANIIIQTVWFYIVAHFFTQIDKRLLRELKQSNLLLETDKEDGREYYWLDYQPPERIRGAVEKFRIYARPGSLCCPVAIIKTYMEHRNPRNEVLFQHPKTVSHDVWYSSLPLGKNKHTDLMKSMSTNAGVVPPLTGRCIRNYVRGLLEDCDQAVNEMFQQVAAPSLTASLTTVHGVLMPKFPGDSEPPLLSPFVLSVPRLPPPILSTTISNPVSIQPRTSTSPNHSTDAFSTQNTHTKTSDVTDTEYGKRFALENSLTKPSRIISPVSSIAAFPSFMLPYPTNFATVKDFAKPIEPSHVTNHNTTSTHATDSSTYALSNNYLANGAHGSPIMNSTDIQSKTHHMNCSNMETCDNSGAKTTNAVVPLSHTALSTQTQNPTAEVAVQTEPVDRQWLESAYHTADLKTRNKMRLQARKSLLCFLEELNEISNGHGTELFYEIVQEDTNMWKSISNSSSK